MNKAQGRPTVDNSKTSAPEAFPACFMNSVLPGRVLVVASLRDGDALRVLDALENRISLFPGEISLPAGAKIARVVRRQFLFERLSVLENLCLPRLRMWRGRQAQVRECQALLQRFGIELDLFKPVNSYTREERKLIELLRAYMQKPDVLLLYDTFTDLGFVAVNCFMRILQALREDGCRIVYFTTHWEDSLRIGDFFAVHRPEGLLDEVHDAKAIKKSPQKIAYLLSGMHSAAEGEEESLRALNSIYRSAELFVKDYELGSTLGFLLEAINTAMGSAAAALYIRDEFGHVNAYAPENAADEAYRLEPQFLNDVFQRSDALFYFFDDDIALNGCFARENDVQTLLCLCFGAGAHCRGMLQLVYPDHRIATEKQILILNAFCNEVGLLIETSRLLNQSTLLRESHHRIKNNLQIIVGIIYNQKARMHGRRDAVDFNADLDSLVGRIKNISMVHDLLTRNAEGGNFISIRDLIGEVLRLFNVGNVRIIQEISDISIMYNKATSLAMIFNEVISNIFKHAFRNTPSPEIHICCRMEDSSLILRICDNGCGLPENFSIETGDSVGMSIIHSLSKSLRANLEIRSGSGTEVTIRIPERNLMDGWIV